MLRNRKQRKPGGHPALLSADVGLPLVGAPADVLPPPPPVLARMFPGLESPPPDPALSGDCQRQDGSPLFLPALPRAGLVLATETRKSELCWQLDKETPGGNLRNVPPQVYR